MRSTITLLGLAALCSCTQEKADRVQQELPGTWVLDSASTPSGSTRSYLEPDEPYSERFTFLNDSVYERDWWHGDVGNTYQGRYFVLRNPARPERTLTGIPGISAREVDTVRMAYDIFDLASLNDSLMVTIRESRFLERDSGTWPAFSERRFYSRKR